MNKGDIAGRLLRGATAGVTLPGGPVELRRYAPCDALAPYVRHFWFVRWRLSEGESRPQSVLPLPAVNLVLEDEHLSLYGPATRRYERQLLGVGAAFGVLFRPAGFQPFVGGSMHHWLDRREPAEPLLKVSFRQVRALAARALQDPEQDEALRSAFEHALLSLRPRADSMARASAWVQRIEEEPSLGRAEVLAERAGVTLRTLQRELRYYVGLGPKALIRRYRLLEAAGRLAEGTELAQAQLALDLGYADQSHFVRDFRAVWGRTPGAMERARP